MPAAYIGMGANLPSPAGPPQASLAAATERLARLGTVTARSHLYSTEPVGLIDQPRFVNAVVALETNLEPRPLLGALQEIEREFGRNRAAEIRNGPRALDLDILLFGDAIVKEIGLEIPHPRMFERAFTLIPLHEIAPDLRDPITGLRVKQWLQRPCSAPRHDNSAIIPIQSDLWRPGVERSAGRHGAS